MRQFPIVVFGATGYTGRLLCAELRRRGERFAIAGRQRDKLEALQKQLVSSDKAGSADLPPPEILVADILNRDSLSRLAESARVIVDCVGPFMLYGPPVLEAALTAGTHYLDITGEYPYMLDTHRRHDEALRREVVLVNGVGFDVVPTDVVAVLAATAYKDEGLMQSDLVQVDIAFGARGRVSRGTARSMLQGMAHGRGGSAAFVAGAWVDEPIAEKVWEAPLPPPIGPQSCISVPWGDVATAPRSTGSPNVRVFYAVPSAVAKAMPLARSLLPILGTAPVQKLLEAAIERIPEGASDAERARAYSSVCAQASFRDGRSATAWLSLGESYTLTAITAALCASLCARPDFATRGALTPTQAFGAQALLDGLIASGATWGVDKGRADATTSRR